MEVGRIYVARVALTLTLLTAAAAATSQSPLLFGINHLAYTSSSFQGIALIIGALVLTLTWWPTKLDWLDWPVAAFDRRTFRLERPLVTIGLGLLAGCIFAIGTVDLHFLGDGYTLLSLYGDPHNNFIRQWPEPLAVPLVRTLQALLGVGATLRIFQSLSILSGIASVAAILTLAGELSEFGKTRFTIGATLLTSGAMLLFFGYVEYYPLAWALTLWYVVSCVRFFHGRTAWWLPCLLFFFAAGMHLQVLILLPGLTYLLTRHFAPRYTKLLTKRSLWPALTLIALVILLTVAALNLQSTTYPLFLRPFVGQPSDPAFAFFSIRHLIGLLNVAQLVFPGLLLLLCLLSLKKRIDNPVDTFLRLSTYGSLLFLLGVDTMLGPAKDWDLLSLALLAPILLVLRLAQQSIERLPRPLIAAYALFAVAMTSCYILVVQTPPSASSRAEQQLFYEGARDPRGWTDLGLFYMNNGEQEKGVRIAHTMQARGIAPGRAAQVLALWRLREEDYSAAAGLLEQASLNYPDDAHLQHTLGRARQESGDYRQAAESYGRAHALSPRNELYLEEFAFAEFMLKQFDRAASLADSLLVLHPNHPGAYLINVLIALDRNDYSAARHWFAYYQRFGRERIEFPVIEQLVGACRPKFHATPGPSNAGP